MEDEIDRLKRLSDTMEDFKNTHYYEAMKELFLRAEYNALRDMINCPEKELIKRQSYICGLQAALDIINLPSIEVEQYRTFTEELSDDKAWV